MSRSSLISAVVLVIDRSADRVLTVE